VQGYVEPPCALGKLLEHLKLKYGNPPVMIHENGRPLFDYLWHIDVSLWEFHRKISRWKEKKRNEKPKLSSTTWLLLLHVLSCFLRTSWHWHMNWNAKHVDLCKTKAKTWKISCFMIQDTETSPRSLARSSMMMTTDQSSCKITWKFYTCPYGLYISLHIYGVCL
jgi:hypothetical protein